MLNQGTANSVTNFVHELTDGKPYIFMIMPYSEGYAFFEKIQAVVKESVGFSCIRADHVHASGHELLSKIHLLIDRAELVIAEISSQSPNVFYEVGYAVGTQKPILLLVKDGTNIPTDLKGIETVSYKDDKEGTDKFRNNLKQHLRLQLNSTIPVLRDMLLAKESLPAYIISSPRYPGDITRIKGQVFDQRTYSDNLGILGLISAFGSLMGEREGVELLSAQYCDPTILERNDVNLYLIGSPKVNPVVRELFPKIQKNKRPNWILGSRPGEPEEGDHIVRLYENEKSEDNWIKGEFIEDKLKHSFIHTLDHGIIIRGPHPKNPNRIVLIMAGPHSLGTGAACLAATRSSLIREIQSALPKKEDLADKSKTIWVLVEGKASEKDYLLDEDGVSILRAGVYN
jgi:hypothetical protein